MSSSSVEMIESVLAVEGTPLPQEGDEVTIHYIAKTKSGRHLNPNYAEDPDQPVHIGPRILA
eukprot:SAG11_NODE_31134_length_294_cov_1.056410_1_plen_62_part_00